MTRVTVAFVVAAVVAAGALVVTMHRLAPVTHYSTEYRYALHRGQVYLVDDRCRGTVTSITVATPHGDRLAHLKPPPPSERARLGPRLVPLTGLRFRSGHLTARGAVQPDLITVVAGQAGANDLEDVADLGGFTADGVYPRRGGRPTSWSRYLAAGSCLVWKE